MSHHNYPNHGRPFKPSPTGPSRFQTDDVPAEAHPPNLFSHSIQHQRYNYGLQNSWTPPAPGHGQPEGHREDIPPPVGGAIGPSTVEDPHRIDMAYQGIVDCCPQPLAYPAYVFPDEGHTQGVQVQDQLMNQERGLFGHVPQRVELDPPQATVPNVSQAVHDVPTPGQPRPEDLRRLASRYWYHPGSEVGTVSVEAGTNGRYKVVITLKTPIGF